MKTFTFDVTRRVTVRLDESKFTKPLMEEFNHVIGDFGTDDDAYQLHAEFIADLFAHGCEEFKPTDFVEGYGPVEAAGIEVCEIELDSIDLLPDGVAA